MVCYNTHHIRAQKPPSVKTVSTKKRENLLMWNRRELPKSRHKAASGRQRFA